MNHPTEITTEFSQDEIETALKVLQKNSTLKKLFQDAITSAAEKSKELSK